MCSQPCFVLMGTAPAPFLASVMVWFIGFNGSRAAAYLDVLPPVAAFADQMPVTAPDLHIRTLAEEDVPERRVAGVGGTGEHHIHTAIGPLPTISSGRRVMTSASVLPTWTMLRERVHSRTAGGGLVLLPEAAGSPFSSSRMTK